MKGLANRFYNLFRGLDRAHGSYQISIVKPTPGKKQVGKAKTIHEAVTTFHWDEHLSGRVGLGIVPIMSDNKCLFGAIDLDVYDLDLFKIESRVNELGLPLIVCRTKSGGAHLYLFGKEHLSSKLVRDKLTEWAIHLGYPKVEIYPKQIELAGEDDDGSWINMPYFDCTKTTRYALSDGKKLNAEEFLQLADDRKISGKDLNDIELPQDPELEDAPPCLQHLARMGFPEGTRNKGLFNLAIFCRKKFGDGWKEKVAEFNNRLLIPPLSVDEVNTITKSANKKSYFYSCREIPLVDACNRTVCARRQFGIAGSNDDIGVILDGLQKILTDPPTWYVSVDGRRVRIDATRDLLDPFKFSTLCVDALNVLPNRVRPTTWDTTIRELLDKVEEIDAPEDAGNRGQFMSFLDGYFTERAMAKHREELLLGKPWEEGGKIYFRSVEMLKYMEKHKFSITAKGAWNILRDLGAETVPFHLKGKFIRCWSMPSIFSRQVEDFSIPEVNKDEF